MNTVVTRVSARSSAIHKRTMIKRGRKSSFASSSNPQTKERKPRQKRQRHDTGTASPKRRRSPDQVKQEQGDDGGGEEVEEDVTENGMVFSSPEAVASMPFSAMGMEEERKVESGEGATSGRGAGKRPRVRGAKGPAEKGVAEKSLDSKDAFKCPFCDHLSGRPNNLVIHINSKHYEENPPRTCSQDPAECVGESILYFLSTKKEFEEKITSLEAQLSLCRQTLGEVLAELTSEQKEHLRATQAEKNKLLSVMLSTAHPIIP